MTGLYLPILLQREEIVALDRLVRHAIARGGVGAEADVQGIEAVAKLDAAWRENRCVQAGGVNRIPLTEHPPEGTDPRTGERNL